MLIEMAGYRVTEKIYESAGSRVYRGWRERDELPVVVKVMKDEYPSPEAIAQYRREYEITKNFELEGVVKTLGLEQYKNGLAIVLEDFGARSLKIALESQRLSIREFFPLAIEITEILGHIHRQKIIHKDINPSNILIEPGSGKVKIIDFGISSFLSKENSTVRNPNILEGTLAYISPEQTGRMNRAIDYRTDFYSLGVTFYELLLGQLPFESSDPMELIHCHIARSPVPPDTVNPKIPGILAAIVMKLLAKTAEERYQSAWGLKADLERCRDAVQHQAQPSSFPLGEHDVSDNFQIREQLYGRETEVATLLAAFDRVAAGTTELMLVAGFSGIGKSALVQEVHKPIVRQRGYFISGKFDQFKRNIPFASLVQAFRDLIRQLLAESEARVAYWKTELLEAFGGDGQVLIDAIPEIEAIVGPQPPVEPLSPTASQNRFNRLFGKFIRVFTRAEHPLVIFLDDLQWADSASLKLLELLVSDTDTRYLFAIGAYRDNEVSPIHPLMTTLTDIRNAGVNVNQITLKPLAFEDLNQLIADALNTSGDRTAELAQLLLAKTQGNPFFSNQFLKSIYEENILEFDYHHGVWQWDLDRVRQMDVADNVVEFMAGKLQKFSPETQRVLKLAACIGNQFDLATLAVVNQKSLAETAGDLWQALDEGSIVPLSDNYRFFQYAETAAVFGDRDLEVTYKFLHDRVQQAAYSLIEESEKQATHYQIGRLFLQAIKTTEELEENIFDLVNQLNYGSDRLDDPEEKAELARLNLRAGQKAKAATAYNAAVKYLKIGLDLLPENCWNSDYEFTFKYYLETAEAEYLNTNFKASEALAKQIEERAIGRGDRVKVDELKMQIYMAESQMIATIETGLDALDRLGIEMWQGSAVPELPPVNDVADLPEMTDPDRLAAMRILVTMAPAAYVAKPEVLRQAILTMVQLSLESGYSALSAYAYAVYGLLLCGAIGELDKGYNAGKLGLMLLDKFHSKALQCKVHFLFNVFIRHWKEPTRNTREPLKKTVQIGVDTGDLEYASFAAQNYCYFMFSAGEPLPLLEEQQRHYVEFIEKVKQRYSIGNALIWRQCSLNLLGQNEDPCRLVGESFNEDEMTAVYRETNNRSSLLHVHTAKGILNYLFGDDETAIACLSEAEQYWTAGLGSIVNVTRILFHSLSLLAVYDRASEGDRAAYRAKIEQNQAQLQRWASAAPENYQHKWELVEAERARVFGDPLRAMESYDRAIAAALKINYNHDAAVARECAMRFYLARGHETIARAYALDAHYAYLQWGAKAKVAQFEQQYPQFFSNARSQGSRLQRSTATLSHSTTGSHSGEVLDLGTILKASQAISGEIVLEKLLSKLIELILENAGAQRGVLILAEEDRLKIQASGDAETGAIAVLQGTDVASSDDLPQAIVNYTTRTLEDVVLADATEAEQFATQPYILRERPRSILCAPILNQGKLVGLVYLENNLTTDAFTPDRLEVVKVLSAQAAISIENALLYRTLERKVEERTAQLAQANREITVLNERLKAENLRMAAELDITRQLQQMILPNAEELSQIEGLDIAGFMQPADEVGGDYYDVLQHGGRVKIGIGDVTGHGLESGMLTIMVQTAVRTLLTNGEADPVRFLDAINRTIFNNVARMNSDKNLSLALLDYADRKLRLSGQHEEVLVIRTGGAIERIDTIDLGFPIGLDDEIADFIGEMEIELNPGDTVVLYTDGITEAENLEGVQYGIDRLCEVLVRHAARSAEEIRQEAIADVLNHIGEQKIFDDLTLLVLKQN